MSFSSSQYPYDTVVEITDTIGQDEFQGSGVLIAPNAVLTAAHVVWSTNVGSASNIEVTPGANDGTAPFGSSAVVGGTFNKVYDPSDLISEQQSQLDFALLVLATPFTNIGKMTIDPDYAGGIVNVTGYPASAGGVLVNSVQAVTQDPHYALLDGPSLTQVAGSSTHAGSDDRYSGDLVVDVTAGNHRGQRDLGSESYAVQGVKIPHRGTLNDSSVATGVVVHLRGTILSSAASCSISSASASSGSSGSSGDDSSDDPSDGGLSLLGGLPQTPTFNSTPTPTPTPAPSTSSDASSDANAAGSTDSSGNDDSGDDASSDGSSADGSSADGSTDDGSADDSTAAAPLVTDVTITTVLIAGQHASPLRHKHVAAG